MIGGLFVIAVVNKLVYQFDVSDYKDDDNIELYAAFTSAALAQGWRQSEINKVMNQAERRNNLRATLYFYTIPSTASSVKE